MLSSTHKRRIDHGERGQVIPIVALALTVLFGAASLAVDVGYWRYQERVQQAAADSAAMAGASEIASGAGGVAAAAAYDATLNGFTDDGGANVKVQVHYPPTSGAYNGNTSAVEVIVEKKQPGFFAKVLGINTQWVRARAVGLVSAWGRYCIYGLSTSGTSVLFNGSTVNTPKCGIVSDADMTINGATVTAWSLGYVGSVINNGSTYPNNSSQPKKALYTSDPCPTVPGCEYLKTHPPSGGTCITPTLYNGGTATMNPGHYCAQVIWNGCTNVVFNPGLYVFDSGTIMNGVTNISGSGVTFYNNSGQLVINGSSVTLSAPSTGNTAGVLIYQNPADSSAFTTNGSGAGYAGMMYFPTSQIVINGTISQWLLIVGSTVTINGSGTNVASSAFPGWGRSVLAE
jgi:hypothetical protein